MALRFIAFTLIIYFLGMSNVEGNWLSRLAISGIIALIVLTLLALIGEIANG